MPIPVTDKISTTAPTDTYATHESNLGQGGYHSVPSSIDRDNIPESRRQIGMLVYVQDEDLIYKLSNDLVSWTLLTTGGSSTGSGIISVATITERDAIPQSDRTSGMLVYVEEDTNTYQLANDLGTWNQFTGKEVTNAYVDQLTGNLIIEYADGSSTTAGLVKGTSGEDGVSVINVDVVKDQSNPEIAYFQTELSNGVTLRTDPINGYNGASVASAEIDTGGNLIFTLTDGSTISAGVADDLAGVGISTVYLENNLLKVQLTDGTIQTVGNSFDFAGVGVSSLDVVNGDLVVTYTDSTTQNVGPAEQLKGDQGVSVVGARIDSVTDELIFELSDSTEISAGIASDLQGAGVQSATIDVNGHLIFTLTDGSTIDAGIAQDLKGEKGEPGTDGTGIQSAEIISQDLVLTLTDESTINVGRVVGKSIQSTVINSSDELIITFDDGSTINVGNVRGEQGTSVTNTEVNADGDLLVYLSDNTTINAGFVRNTTQSLVGQTYNFQASDQQTEFAVNHQGDVLVFVNLQLLDDSELDLSSGNLVRLITPLNANDDVKIITYTPGALGASGRGVTSIAPDPTNTNLYTVTLEDGTTYQIEFDNTVDPSTLPPGIENAVIDINGDLIIYLSDGSNINAGSVQGADYITAATIDGNGDLIITLNTTETINAGQVNSGLTITDAYIDINGNLILVVNNGEQTIDAGPVSESINTTDVNIDSQGQLIVTLSDGTTINAGDTRNPVLGQVYDIIAFAGQTDFSVVHNGNVMVYANGVALSGDDYILSDPNIVSLTTPRKENDIIRIVLLSAGSVSANSIVGEQDALNGSVYGKNDQGDVGFYTPGLIKIGQPYDYVATSGQQTFNLNHNGNVEVIVNGSHLMEDEFFVNNITRVTLANPLNSGDMVRIIVLSAPKPMGDMILTNYNKLEYVTFEQNTGTSISGNWYNRPLNTISVNGIGLSLLNNRIIVPTGTYYTKIRVDSYLVSPHVCRVFNSSMNQELIKGYSSSTDTCFLEGYFSVSSQSALYVQHKVGRSRSYNGQGLIRPEVVSLGEPTSLVSVELWKVS